MNQPDQGAGDRRAQSEQARAEPAKREPVFALDIGTRSVIGLVGIPEEGGLRLLGVEVLEHAGRAVVDGQIEDIAQTARIAAQVKQSLEEMCGVRLTQTCVAAAGRRLVTRRSMCTLELDGDRPIGPQDVQELEAHAVQKAYEELGVEYAPEEGFYCVGHSVVRYHLDDYPISTLIGHRGKRAQAEIIATFLPGEVVESLYSAMAAIGLTVASLTLEPIAAMNAVVPKELRMLNLALVDIGAGTSDIAISRDGSVVAYTMATIAGDEVTETLMRSLLVDFDTAEQIKRSLAPGSEVAYNDILGLEHLVPASELLEQVSGVLDDLAQTVAEKILEQNGAAPAAVFLAGGGSRIPGLCARVGRALGLDEKKVAVGGGNYMKRVALTEFDISGPEYATPVGIALTALQDWERDSFTVTVNGTRVQLLRSGAVRVMDVLMRCGYRYSQLIGRSGRPVTFMLNHEKKTARGGLPAPAEILVNAAPASISTLIGRGDDIVFRPAQSGRDAAPLAADFLSGAAPFEVTLNGAPETAGARIRLNGAPAGPPSLIRDLDELEIQMVSTAGDLCAVLGLDASGTSFLIGARRCGPQELLHPGDVILYPAPPVREEPAAPPPEQGALTQPAAKPPAANAPAQKTIRIVLNGAPLILPERGNDMPYQFIDMLNYVDIDPSKPQGNILLRINGHGATYLEPVHNGDEVEIRWDTSF